MVQVMADSSVVMLELAQAVLWVEKKIDQWEMLSVLTMGHWSVGSLALLLELMLAGSWEVVRVEKME